MLQHARLLPRELCVRRLQELAAAPSAAPRGHPELPGERPARVLVRTAPAERRADCRLPAPAASGSSIALMGRVRSLSQRCSRAVALCWQKASSVVLRGCRCKKSKCMKKYCECYQSGVACTAHCRCVDCSNDPKSAHHVHKGTREAAGGARVFHEIQVTVTKKPKRNHVRSSIRLAL